MGARSRKVEYTEQTKSYGAAAALRVSQGRGLGDMNERYTSLPKNLICFVIYSFSCNFKPFIL